MAERTLAVRLAVLDGGRVKAELRDVGESGQRALAGTIDARFPHARRRTVCDVLEVAGFAVAEAANGREAVEHLETEPADVVITGIPMPVQEGIETIAILRKRHPGLKILAISCRGRTGSRTGKNGLTLALLMRPFAMGWRDQAKALSQPN